MPILTFLAMMSGLAGGLLVAWGTADISPVLFFNRLQSAVGVGNLWVSVESLGQRTTTSVVQAIFAVILVDALFAILFFQMGV